MTTLLDRLITLYPSAKRQTFKQMLQAGRILINGKQARSLKLSIDADAHVEILPRRLHGGHSNNVAAKALPFEIIFEDRDVLVIDKPAGLLTSTTPRETRPTAWAAVQDYVLSRNDNAQPGLIHRLDRDASGLLVFSKSAGAYRALKTQFFHHTVTRSYVAVVHGRMNPADSRIESHLEERADGTVFSRKAPGGGQRAITDYRTIESNKRFALLRVTLLTGRKHQIRAHLAERGHPIVGDSMYGKSNAASPLMLRAIELCFDHPTTRHRERLKLPTPDAMRDLVLS